jgi:thiol-disulfide isomerase/thioredoxin
MKKTFLFLFFACIHFLSFSQNNKWFTVRAFLPRWNGAEISLFSNNQLLYSGTVIKDMLAFTGNINMATQGSIKIKSGKTVFYIPVFFEPGTIKIRDAGNKALVAYGTPLNDIYLALNKNFDSLSLQQKDLAFSEAVKFKRELATSFIQNNPSSIISVQFLKEYYYLSQEADDTLYYSLLHSLDNSLQTLFYVEAMRKEATTRNATAIGKTPTFLLVPDTCGRLAELHKTGEYTLINFWASWCIPCRRENKELVKLFEKYRTQGFAITSVSIDTNKFLWLNAIKRDGLLWQQLSDLQGWESTAARAYGIKGIPMNYLINPEGKIIAKNIYTQQLSTLLYSLLKINPSKLNNL